MLRSKQLGTLSQCARSFVLANSRSSSGDGAACTCPEDETYAPRRSAQRNSTRVYQNRSSKVKSDLPSGTGGSKIPGLHVISATNCTNVQSLTSTSRPEKDADSGSYSVANSSKMVSGRFIKKVSTSVLSEFARHNITVNDVSSSHSAGGDVASSSQQDSALQSTHKNRSSESKKIHALHTDGRSDTCYGSQVHFSRNRSNRSNSCKAVEAVEHEQLELVKATVEPIKSSTTKDRRKCLIQRTGSTDFTSDKAAAQRTSDEKVAVSGSATSEFADKLGGSQRPSRSTKRNVNTSSKISINTGRPVELFYQTLRQQKWGLVAEAALENLRCNVDPFQANQILKLLQDHSVAFGFFNWLKCQPGFKHDGHTYTTMIGILGRARQFCSVWGLLDEMVMNGCRPNVVTYNRIIHGYGRANYINDAMKVFYEMQGAGCKPDRVTFSTLIDIHAKAGYLDVAMKLYQQMIEANLLPDTFTYSVMINCLGKAGHLPAAYKLFCEMIDHGCVPNLVTYNIMIAIQAKARNYPCALKLYRSMQAAGFSPDKVTYSIIMDVLGHCGHLEEMEAVFMEMKEHWIPDEPAYGLLVDLWGKAGNADKAHYWYISMLDAGLRPNVPTCNSLLSAFLRVENFLDAYTVLQNMLGFGLHPSLQTYTLLLSCCTEAGSKMVLYHDLMSLTNHPAHAFLSSLPAAEPGGCNVKKHANAFLDLMHSEDRESKRGLVDAVTNFLHKSGLKEEAGAVWEAAAEKNIYPDAVGEKRAGYWLINLHVMSEGTAVTALSRTLTWFRRHILASGIGPHRIDIVTGWGRRSRVTGSSSVRETIKDLLNVFRSPFNAENGNSGCFVGLGEPLYTWLLHSSIERMHLV